MSKLEGKDLENATEWVRILRSGKYKQGNQRLLTKDNEFYKFCCLGVYCDALVTGFWNNRGGDQVFYEETSSGDHDYNFTRYEIPWMSVSDVSTVIEMNDGGFTFPQIADWVEKNYLGDAS